MSLLCLVSLTYSFSFLTVGDQEVSFRNPLFLLVKRGYNRRQKYFNKPTLFNVQVVGASSKAPCGLYTPNQISLDPMVEKGNNSTTLKKGLMTQHLLIIST